MNSEDKGFLVGLRLSAEQKAEEYAGLRHEQQRLDMVIERTRVYIEQLNAFVTAEETALQVTHTTDK